MGLSPYMTMLEVVNEVCDRMTVRRVTTTNANYFTQNLIRLLNDIVEELLDYGEWNQLKSSASFAMVCGQSHYNVATTALTTAKWFMHSISEARVSGRIPPLEPIADDNEGRMLLRTRSTGTPSRYFLEGQDGLGNPMVAIFPRPGATWDGVNGYVKFMVQPPRYEPGTDDAVVLPFPGRVLVAGLHAAAILDESGGTETAQYKTECSRYLALRNSAISRHKAKTGEFTQFVPGTITRS